MSSQCWLYCNMRDINLQDTLQKIYLFSKMDANELKDLSQICTVHHYEEDTVLFLQGERGKHLLILIEGIVSVYKHDDKGNEIIINYFKPTSLIAEPALLQGVPYPSSATFKEKGTLIKIELEAFKENFLLKGHVALNIINSLLSKIQLLQHNISINISGSAKEKIIYYYQNEGKMPYSLKQYEIASLLNISQETLSRYLKQLQTEGVIEKRNSRYHLVSKS